MPARVTTGSTGLDPPVDRAFFAVTGSALAFCSLTNDRNLALTARRLILGYIRVSTGSSAQQISREGQRFQLQEAGCDEIIEDVLSGSGSVVRPGWERLRLMVARGEVAVVRFVDLSRLARDGTDQDLLEECAAAGTEVIDLNGGKWENQTVHGLLSSGILSVVNQAQSRMISVKVKDGIERRKRQGFIARGRLPFGYLHQDGQALKHPEQWPVALRMVEDLLAWEMNWCGAIRAWRDSPEPIGREWSPYGLKTWWFNPMLRGGIGEGLRRNPREFTEVAWGVAPVLISPTEWISATRMLERRARVKGLGGKGKSHLFTGMIRCDACGRALAWDTRAQRNPNTPRINRYACKNPNCNRFGNGVRESVIKELVAKALVRRAEEMVRIAWQPEPVNSEARQRLVGQIAQLEALRAQGVEGLDRTVIRLRNELVEMDMPDEPLEEDLTYGLTFRKPSAFIAASDDELRPVVLWFVKQIHYHGGPDSCTVTLHRRMGRQQLTLHDDIAGVDGAEGSSYDMGLDVGSHGLADPIVPSHPGRPEI